MGRIAMFFGVVLIVLGIGLYATADPNHRSPTALIPCAFGLALFLLGLAARGGSEQVRKHTMHAASVIALIGLAIPAYRVVVALLGGADITDRAIAGQIAMAVLCAIFLVLCIKSFIDARVARKQRELTGSTEPHAGGSL